MKKVSRKYIEEATANGELLGENGAASQLFKILLAGAGFGSNAKSFKSLASAMYADEPTINNHLSMEPRLKGDTRSYADTRLANLARGGASFAPREADYLYEAFVNVFGSEWGKLLTPKDLVLSSPQETFQKLLGKGLPWPDNFPASAVLSILATAYEDPGFSIRPVDATKLSLSGPKGHENQDLRMLDPRPVLEAESSNLIEVRRKGLLPGSIFLFEVSDYPMDKPIENESFEIFPHNLAGVSRRLEHLTNREGGAFFVYNAPGEFSYFALEVDADIDFSVRFECDPTESKWNLETSQKFIRHLRKLFLEKPDTAKIARYAYLVR